MNNDFDLMVAKLPSFKALSAKRQKFVLAYNKHRQGTRAAVEAGYAVASANRQGYVLLQREDVQVAINEIKAITFRSDIADKDEILEIYTDLVRPTIADFLDQNGRVDVLKVKDPKLAHAVKKFKIKTSVLSCFQDEIELELYSKREVGDSLAKLRGYTQDVGAPMQPIQVNIDLGEK